MGHACGWRKASDERRSGADGRLRAARAPSRRYRSRQAFGAHLAMAGMVATALLVGGPLARVADADGPNAVTDLNVNVWVSRTPMPAGKPFDYYVDIGNNGPDD